MNKYKKLKDDFPNMLKEWLWLLKYIKKFYKGVISIVLLGVATTVLGIIFSVASKDLIDTVISHDTGKIGMVVAYVVGISLAQIVTSALQTRVIVIIQTDVTNKLRSEMFDKILSSKLEYLHDYHSGEIINRLEGDVTNISNGIVSFVPALITNLVQFFGVFVVIMFYDVTMAILSLLSAPILLFSSRFLMRMMHKYNEKIRTANGEILAFNEEVFRNVQLVKAFSLAKNYCKNLAKLLKNYRNLQLEYTKFKVLTTIVMSLVGLIVSGVCYAWGVWQLWNGVISYGVMTMFLSLSAKLTASFSALVSLAPSAISTATSAGRIIDIINTPSENDENSFKAANLCELSKQKGLKITFNDVSFKYKDAENYILKNINLTITGGETVAFIGPSGEGKSTLLKLVLGLISPTSGTITVSTVDGENEILISDSTRRLCAFVPQGNQLFSGTIASNLSAVEPKADTDDILKALRLADAENYISAMPHGVNTELKENAINISEGQAQRIAIARAMIKDAPILVMDEATSALDPPTESRVLKNIMENKPNRICIISTHRTSMLDYASRVFRISALGGLEEIKE